MPEISQRFIVRRAHSLVGIIATSW